MADMSVFRQNIIDIYGNDGKKWLDALPALLKELAHNWQLELGHALPNLTYSYVCLAKKDGHDVVLKVAPKNPLTLREIAWYRYQPSACPQLIAADDARYGLLLEYLRPGISLKTKVQQGLDDEATTAIAKLIVDLKVTTPDDKKPFRHVAELERDMDILHDTVASSHFFYAKHLFKRLLENKEAVLLHGDLHHDNILSHNGTYKAIDPHGYLGPKAFEVGAFMRNPYDCFPSFAPLATIIDNRLNILYKTLPFTRDEIDGWTLIYMLIAASWSMQDHGECPQEHLDIINVMIGRMKTS